MTKTLIEHRCDELVRANLIHHTDVMIWLYEKYWLLSGLDIHIEFCPFCGKELV